GLLAAATQPSRSEDGMVDSSILQSSSLNNSVIDSVGATIGFPALSTTDHPSPPSSPSRLLQHSEENQWLNNEVNDFSLSSLLGHFDSPMKGSSKNSQSSSNNVALGNGQPHNNVYHESTVDFTSKFAEMKAEQAAKNLYK
ncbi:unnamed protein product, partial [Meganyctiphanes norvegica]